MSSFTGLLVQRITTYDNCSSQSVVVAFSVLAEIIMVEGSTNHSPPALFLFLFLKLLQRTNSTL